MALIAWIVSFWQAIWLHLQQAITDVAENRRDQMRTDELERKVGRLQREITRLKQQAKEYKKYHSVCRRIDSERVQDVLREERTLENENSQLQSLIDDLRAVLRNTRRIAQCTQADGDNGTGNGETTLNRDLENDRDQMRVDQLQREVEQLQRENVRLKRQAKEYREYHLVCRRLDSKRLQDVLHEKTALEDRVDGLENEKRTEAAAAG